MRGERVSIGLSAVLAIFAVVLFAASTWVAAQKRCCIASAAARMGNASQPV